MSSTPLAARSPNTHLASSNNEQDLKTASTTMNSMEHHRQILQGKLDSQEKYVVYPVKPLWRLWSGSDTNIATQATNVRLSIWRHHEPLLKEAQRPQGKALQEVCLSLFISHAMKSLRWNTNPTSCLVLENPNRCSPSWARRTLSSHPPSRLAILQRIPRRVLEFKIVA